MIKKIQIQNFKCFQNTKTFEFSKLNLLTGINGRGKSSLLQSILLLSQSTSKLNFKDKLKLNGKHIDLGNFDDIKNSETTHEDKIFIELDFEELKASFYFSENENDNMSALVEGEIKLSDSPEMQNFNQFSEKFQRSIVDIIGQELNDNQDDTESMPDLYLKNFFYHDLISKIHYISADRLGPVKYVDKISFSDFVSVGSKGEYTLNVLAKTNLPLVYDELYLGEDSKSVIQQTQEWLSYILEGAKIDIKGRDKDSSVLYMLINNKNNSYKYKPTNVGFGYSYILPLIVSGLIAKENEILIIENPEAHLHPRAQSRIAEFFSKVASCGIQVFIESHSEHILNGLRVSALNPEIGISNNELAIHYFNELFDSNKLTMDEKGKIPNWPNGFFDQQELDLAEIFKYSRKS
jgi:predicted ATPase